jgi:hypothetical protein
MRRGTVWIPVLLIGSALYWTVALRLGSVSLGMLGSSPEQLELVPAMTIDVDIIEEPVNLLGNDDDAREKYEAEEMPGDPIIVRLEPVSIIASGGVVSGFEQSATSSRATGGGGVAGGGTSAAADDGAPPPPPVEDSIGRTAF